MTPRDCVNSADVRKRLIVVRDATCPSDCPGRTSAGCALIPASRVVCTYSQGSDGSPGPEGWSRFAGDPDIKPQDNAALEFIGVHQSILERDDARLLFVLTHELEHERQRFCQNRVQPGLAAEILNEVRANRAAWRFLFLQRRVNLATYIAAVLCWIAPISLLGPLMARSMFLAIAVYMGLVFLPGVLWDVVFGLPLLGIPFAPALAVVGYCLGFLWAHLARSRSR
jgi:hypothetical protein